MMKRWKRVLGTAVVFGWASGAALAQQPAPVPALLESGSGASAGSGSSAATLPPATAVYSTGSSIFEADNGHEKCGWGLDAGGGLHVLRPVITNNAGQISTTFTLNSSSNSVDNFKYDFVLSPSAWIGYTTQSGLGFRASWFQFYESAHTLTGIETPTSGPISSPSGFVGDTSSGPGTPPLGSETALYTATNNLFMDIWDFDVTQSFKVCHLNVTAGAGVRYMHMSQGFGATRIHTGLLPDDIDNESENDSNNFNGWGPTILLEANRPFGCSGFSIYSNARAGVLFGARHENCTQKYLNTLLLGPNIPPQGTITFSTSSDSDQVIGFAEIEAGAQWAKQYGRFQPFVRVGFEGRGYFGTGNAQSGAVPGILGGIHPGVPSLGNNSDIGLFGMTFQAGVSF
jgi:hypothetical protein